MKPMNRRRFLRAAGSFLALPWFEASGGGMPPRRMVFIMTNMGVMPRYFFPEATGRAYQETPYLDLLKGHRERFTIFSGISHPGVDGQHLSEKSFLSGAPHPAASHFQNSLSVDQWAAEQIGPQTRFSSLVLRVGKGHEGTPSTTRDGVPIPPEASPAALYRKLFVQGTPEEVERGIDDLRKGGSILDFVRDEARGLQKELPARDRDRLEQYFTSVRELEVRLQHAEAWERKPKPPVAVAEPKDIPSDAEVEAQTNLMYDTMRLALETDSTRVVSLYLGPLLITPNLPGVKNQTHALTHHGNDEAKIAELRRIEEAQFRSLAGLLDDLHAVREGEGSLLDQTMVLYGSNLSNANAHDTTNLPILLAGGGFAHGQHLAFDRKQNKPLANLFVTMLQHAGFEIDQFSSSTGTITL
jgi:BMFP domain-containing protein YqiC